MNIQPETLSKYPANCIPNSTPYIPILVYLHTFIATKISKSILNIPNKAQISRATCKIFQRMENKKKESAKNARDLRQASFIRAY